MDVSLVAVMGGGMGGGMPPPQNNFYPQRPMTGESTMNQLVCDETQSVNEMKTMNQIVCDETQSVNEMKTMVQVVLCTIKCT